MNTEEAKAFSLSAEELKDLEKSFLKADEDGSGYIELKELRGALKLVGFDIPGYECRLIEEQFRKNDLNKDNRLSLVEFQKLYSKLKNDEEAKSFKKAIKPINNDVKIIKSEESNRVMFIKNTEKEAFTRWINERLFKDPDLHLTEKPITAEGNDLFARCNDGLLLCKLINLSVPDTIDERSLNKSKNLSIYQKLENLELALRSAEAIGCHVINIRPADIRDGKEHLILSLMWQTIQIGLFAEITLAHHPGLILLLKDGEEKEDLLRLSKEELLLRWVNYQLSKTAYGGKEIKNFTEDIKDSTAYTYLLKQIAPADHEPVLSLSPLNEKDMHKRAERMLQEADKLNARQFVGPSDVVSGHPKLNMAFVANLFNTFPCLETDQETVVIEENREEKTYRNWMNSLGVKPKVNYLYSDLQNCLAIFQLYETIRPGTVDFNKVCQQFDPKKARFQKLDNCNYAIELGKKPMNFKLVGIQGSNLLNGDKTYTLALLWQLMRAYVLSLLEKLAGTGSPIGEAGIIEWANQKLQSAGKDSSFGGFQDPILSDSRVICDLIDAIRPNSVKFELLKSEDDVESKMDNARYAVSISRKIGARVFALPEDIVEVKQKMVMTIFATLMILDLQSKQQ